MLITTSNIKAKPGEQQHLSTWTSYNTQALCQMAPDFLYSALLSYRALWVHQPFWTGLLVCADFIWVLILAAVQAFNSVSVGVYLKGCSPFCTWRLKLDFSTRHVCFRSTPKCHNTVGGHRGSLMMKIIACVLPTKETRTITPGEHCKRQYKTQNAQNIDVKYNGETLTYQEEECKKESIRTGSSLSSHVLSLGVLQFHLKCF